MSLSYILDTNICIYITKQVPHVLKQFESLNIGEAAMSAITYGELLYGAHKSNHTEKALFNLKKLSHFIPPLPVSISATQHYGEIRNSLEKQGTPIGANDLWIAAHALALNATLITNNEKEFRRVEGLKIENWAKN